MKVIAIEVHDDSWGHEVKRYHEMSGKLPDTYYHLLGYYGYNDDLYYTKVLPEPDAGKVFITYDEKSEKSNTKWSVLCTVTGLEIKDRITGRISPLFKGQEVDKNKKYVLLISG